MPHPRAVPSQPAGEDVQGRLSVANGSGSGLGLRSLMTNSQTPGTIDHPAPGAGAYASTQQQWTTEQWGYQQSQPYSMPPTTSPSYQLSSTRAAFQPPTYSSSPAGIAPSAYSMPSNGFPQSQSLSLRASEPSLYDPTYTQLQHPGSVLADDHDATQSYAFPPFTTNSSMATGGYDPYPSRTYDDGSRGNYSMYGGGSGNSSV